jgi:hypothetical protein
MARVLLGDSLLLRGLWPWPSGVDAADGDLGGDHWMPKRQLRVVARVPSSSRQAAAVGSAGPCPRPCGRRGGDECVVRRSGHSVGLWRQIWGDLYP